MDVKCTSSMHICGLILAGVGRVIGSVFIIAVPDDMLHDNVHCVCRIGFHSIQPFDWI